VEIQDVSATPRLARVRRLCDSGAARAIRVAARVSLREVGRDVGVARQTVLKWERAERKPTGEAAIRYLRLLEELSS